MSKAAKRGGRRMEISQIKDMNTAVRRPRKRCRKAKRTVDDTKERLAMAALERAQALLGHQTPALTAKVYRRGPRRVDAARSDVARAAAATGPQLGLDFGGCP